ncbi:hypothetical protein [Metabacillus schmidteae]|uniref:hypothetical protein n=1 Tax=Metabacillus schmidteae TaxID=2730405 RepID=UPI00158B88E3|nr:hypothetical protein [Metabacillus schmidteae]
MEISSIKNSELFSIYLKYKKQLKIYKQRESFYDLNKTIEIKKYLSIIKWEMKRRGLTPKAAKDCAVSFSEK